uniref:Uncharacterized protein n=1 Tax=Glossina brevipalpis TaxID=37001 RepID=A0A1A9WYV8_9MUSC
MRRFKNKVYNKFEDFYEASDLKDPDTPKPINLTINDFDSKGKVTNPRAPCVVTTIDPDYSNAMKWQRCTRKFRMKTDILRLREIVRNKFLIYATQERYIERQQEIAHQEEIYSRITAANEFMEESLNKIEANAFNEMKETQKELEKLKDFKINDELNELKAQHQRVMLEVQEVYGRFLFLLKLISYFDNIIDPEDIKQQESNTQLDPLQNITGFENNNGIGEKDIALITNYIETIVKPYLAKRTHLNADRWFKGYEHIRQKIFNYYCNLTRTAVLNHVIFIMNEKSEKTFARLSVKPVMLKKPEVLQQRLIYLRERALNILDIFEKKQKEDHLWLKVKATIPIVLTCVEKSIDVINGKDNIEMPAKIVTKQKKSSNHSKKEVTVSTRIRQDHHENTVAIVEKLQWHVMKVLQDLEEIPPIECKRIERNVRKRMQMRMDSSRKALIRQNRLRHWLEHFKKHEILRHQEQI